MIGVVVLTFQSADVIEACLESLRVSDHQDLRVVVCDNKSTDETVDVLRYWAAKHALPLAETVPNSDALVDTARFTLLQNGANHGYAGGVNAGLQLLLKDQRVDLFWILNPDSEATPGAAGAYARCAAEDGPFSLMGGRTQYHEAPRAIQSDGGRVSLWSGICRSVNTGLLPQEAITPGAADLDYISGANMVASRAFIEQAGLMVEDYFLYYEEVDWAARRGNMPLAFCQEAVVFHHGGTAIGSGTINRRASAFSNYFNYRNRMRFMRRFRPLAIPISWSLSMLRVVKLYLIGASDEAWAAMCGLNSLPPPRAVRDRISPCDQERAFKMREYSR